jgi:hypothetical protein
MHAAWKLAILALIASVGVVVTSLLYNEVVSGESVLGRESFKGAFTAMIGTFSTFMVGQVRGVRAIGDAISSKGAVPEPAALDRVR